MIRVNVCQWTGHDGVICIFENLHASSRTVGWIDNTSSSQIVPTFEVCLIGASKANTCIAVRRLYAEMTCVLVLARVVIAIHVAVHRLYEPNLHFDIKQFDSQDAVVSLKWRYSGIAATDFLTSWGWTLCNILLPYSLLFFDPVYPKNTCCRREKNRLT